MSRLLGQGYSNLRGTPAQKIRADKLLSPVAFPSKISAAHGHPELPSPMALSSSDLRSSYATSDARAIRRKAAIGFAARNCAPTLERHAAPHPGAHHQSHLL